MMTLSRCSLCSLLVLAAIALLFCARSEAEGFGPSVDVVDGLTFKVEALPVKGFMIGRDTTKGTFFLLSQIEYKKGLKDVYFDDRYLVQEVSLKGVVVNKWPIKLMSGGIDVTDTTYALSPNHCSFAYFDWEKKSIRVLDITTGADEEVIGGLGAGIARLRWLSEAQFIFLDHGRHKNPPQVDKLIKVRLPDKEVDVLYEMKEWYSLMSLAVAPGGRLVAFADWRNPGPDLRATTREITEEEFPMQVLLDVETKEAKDLGRSWGSTCWSADGRQLAYFGGHGEITVYSVADQTTRVIATRKRRVCDMVFIGNSYLLWVYEGETRPIRYDLNKNEQTVAPHEIGTGWWRPFGETLILAN